MKTSTIKTIWKKFESEKSSRRKRPDEISTIKINFLLFSNFVKFDWSSEFTVKDVESCQKHHNELIVWIYYKTDKSYKHRKKKRHIYIRRLCFRDLLDWLSMFIICWKVESCQKHLQAMTFIDWIYHKINKHRRNRREKRKKKKKWK